MQPKQIAGPEASLDEVMEAVAQMHVHQAAPSGQVASPAIVGSPLANAPSDEGSALGLVERLRNGGQPDLADMAEGLLFTLIDMRSYLESMRDTYARMGFQAEFVDPQLRAVNTAIAKATACAIWHEWEEIARTATSRLMRCKRCGYEERHFDD